MHMVWMGQHGDYRKVAVLKWVAEKKDMIFFIIFIIKYFNLV